jgi:hypothetical protein
MLTLQEVARCPTGGIELIQWYRRLIGGYLKDAVR